MTPGLFDITGRTALVTGSSRGLGKTLATGLLDAGATVVLHGRGGAVLDATRDELDERAPGRVSSISFDVTDAAAVARSLDALVAERGAPDILVNNAGVQHRAPVTDFLPEDFDRVMNTNLASAFYVSQRLSRPMAARGSGKIIMIGSVQSQLARRTIAPYSASKGGLIMLAKGLAADLAAANIQVNSISPGYFITDMNEALWSDPEFDSWVRNRTPAQRWGALNELIGALLFFASDASSFVSGQNLFVDGGMTSVV